MASLRVHEPSAERHGGQAGSQLGPSNQGSLEGRRLLPLCCSLEAASDADTAETSGKLWAEPKVSLLIPLHWFMKNRSCFGFVVVAKVMHTTKELFLLCDSTLCQHKFRDAGRQDLYSSGEGEESFHLLCENLWF